MQMLRQIKFPTSDEKDAAAKKVIDYLGDRLGVDVPEGGWERLEDLVLNVIYDYFRDLYHNPEKITSHWETEQFTPFVVNGTTHWLTPEQKAIVYQLKEKCYSKELLEKRVLEVIGAKILK